MATVVPPGKRLVCRPWITTKNGKRIYARHHGKRAFCFLIDE